MYVTFRDRLSVGRGLVPRPADSANQAPLATPRRDQAEAASAATQREEDMGQVAGPPQRQPSAARRDRSRVRFASNGYSSRPAPCEAK